MYLIAKQTGGYQAIPIKVGDKWDFHKLLVGRKEARIILRVQGRRYLLYHTRELIPKYPFLRQAHLIPGAEVRTSEVYARYRRWCEENGAPIENGRNFNAGLRSMAEIARKRPKAGGGMTTMLLGYQLVPTEPRNE